MRFIHGHWGDTQGYVWYGTTRGGQSWWTSAPYPSAVSTYEWVILCGTVLLLFFITLDPRVE